MRLPEMKKYMDIYPDKSRTMGLEYSIIIALIFGDTYSKWNIISRAIINRVISKSQ